MSTPDPVAVFRVEAVELLASLEAGLLDLGDDLADKDLIDSVFRSLHTLKGSGAMFGFDDLAAFTHHCETAFDRVRKGVSPATPDLVAAVLAAKDHMHTLLDGAGADHGSTGDALLEGLRAAVEGADALISTAGTEPASDTDGLARWIIRFRLPVNAMANGTNPLGLLDELRDLGNCTIVADLSQIPPLDQLAATELHVGWTVRLCTEKPRAEIEDVFIFVMDDMTLEIDEVAPRTPADDDAPQENGGTAEEPEAVPEHSAQAAGETVDRPRGGTAARSGRSEESMRIPAGRLDDLMNRVGELVIAQSRLSQLAHASTDIQLRAVSEEVERLSGELRDTMMVLRMVPVGSLFGRFRRLVHDLARDTGKAIELITEGESTEVDKTVIERLADPLVHLIRNSADHGLEGPDGRKGAGKSETGHVVLSAHQSGGEVIITVSDDGRGIDPEKIRQKAETIGLIEPGAPLSEQEILQLIFHPGFSTAQQVTNLSGRGVGMDVVKQTVEALRGTIQVRSRLGEGTEITLRIPLTLAIIDGLLVRVGDGRYVIPLYAVEECLELSLEEDLRSRGRSFISLRDSLVPFLRLRDLFATGTKPDPYQKMVVVSTGNERVGLVVDQIIGDHQTVIKSMSRLHRNVEMFSGATILGDGSVALILDILHLVAAGQQEEARLRAAG